VKPAVRIVFSGGGAQARRLDARWPHQSREHAAAYNSVVEVHLGKRWNISWAS